MYASIEGYDKTAQMDSLVRACTDISCDKYKLKWNNQAIHMSELLMYLVNEYGPWTCNPPIR